MTTASKKKVKGIAASNAASAQVSSTPKRGGNKRNFRNAVKFTESTINEQFSLQSSTTTPIKDISTINDINESIITQEYSVGSYIIVQYRDGSHRVAKIIQRSHNNNTSNTNQSETKLYVHYNDFNRRMDEWIDLKRVISIASPEQQADNIHGHNTTATTASSSSTNDDKGDI